ncbi:hypothetical protein [Nonomuraea maritima]|uniref:hypothetical protein n=1 Tax=Nonomuraea maritima TaxID=683260 RepID=UPI00372265F0
MSRERIMENQDKLDSSPFPDDLREELVVKPARRTSKLTLTLAAAVVLVAGILIGVQAHKLFGSPGAAAVASRFGDGGFPRRGGQPGEDRQPGGGRMRGGAGGAGGTLGTVEKVEDGKVYVRTMTGETVTVTTSGDTAVQVTRQGKVTDLEPGTTIVVRGERGADGTVTARTITQGGGGFQGGGPR